MARLCQSIAARATAAVICAAINPATSLDRAAPTKATAERVHSKCGGQATISMGTISR